MFESAPELWPLRQLINHCNEGEKAGFAVADGSQVWYPARPEGQYRSFRDRIRLAWMVFTGKADAVYWPRGQ